MLRATGSRSLLPSQLHASPHISTHTRLVHRGVESIGLETVLYGTHSMRRTKAAQIYRKTGNLRAVRSLLGHTEPREYCSISRNEVDDALTMAGQIRAITHRPPASPRYFRARAGPPLPTSHPPLNGITY